jgi:membrane associated rhomboid family serine protease
MKVPIKSHLLFTVGFVTTTVTVMTYIDHQSLYRLRPLYESMKSKKDILKRRLQEYRQQLKPTNNISEVIKTFVSKTRDYEKVAYGLIAINSLVFLVWQVPSLSRFMNRHFVHLPIRSSPYTLFTCVFSHQNLMHFGFNMVCYP